MANKTVSLFKKKEKKNNVNAFSPLFLSSVAKFITCVWLLKVNIKDVCVWEQ